MLQRVVYVSAAVSLMGADEIDGILQVSRRNNARLGVTGLLLYHDGSFFQVLEGPGEGVEGLYQRIARDRRHRGIIRMLSGPAQTRAFPEWLMGFVPMASLGADQQRGALSLIELARGDRPAPGAGPADRSVEALMRSFLRGFRDLPSRVD